jgi:hypothetical protein
MCFIYPSVHHSFCLSVCRHMFHTNNLTVTAVDRCSLTNKECNSKKKVLATILKMHVMRSYNSGLSCYWVHWSYSVWRVSFNDSVCQYNLPLVLTCLAILGTLTVHGLFCLPDLEIESTSSVTGRQGMLTPPTHLTPPLVCLRSVFAPFSDLYYL